MVRKLKILNRNFSVPRLVSIARKSMLDSLIQSTAQINYNDFKNAQILVRELMDQLPLDIQNQILKEAELTLDSPDTIKTLLLIWISVIKTPWQRLMITTPKQLGSNKTGRLLILNHVLQVSQKPSCAT